MLMYTPIDPVALRLGPIAIHWYGLTYLAAFGLFMLLAMWRLRHEPFASIKGPGAWTRKDVEDILFDRVEGVRALTVRILASAGYRVYEGCDGVDALDTLRTLSEPVDLLISDVMMPRMNGSELTAHFQRMQPGTPILLISGYMDEETVRRAFNEPDAILPKPFTPDALLSRVRELIGAAKR